jgi:FdhD protein
MSEYEFVSEVEITRIEDKNRFEVTDLTAREVELTILINNRKTILLNCSPGNYKYLAIGFLYTNGIITGKEDIISINTGENVVNIELNRKLILAENLINPHLPIGSSKSKTENVLNKLNNQEGRGIKSETIFALFTRMQEKAYWFNKTGGVHSCALADREGSLLLFCEDVSRYNTIDRTFGEALFKNISMKDKILLTSCRITGGIMKKIIKGGIVTIASRSAVTDSAIALANEKGTTLIGFARDNRLNIYSHPENIMD